MLKVSCYFFGMIVSCWFQPYDSFTMAANDEVTRLAGYHAHRMTNMCAFMSMDIEQLEGESYNRVQSRTKNSGPALKNSKSFKDFNKTYEKFKIA